MEEKITIHIPDFIIVSAEIMMLICANKVKKHLSF